MTSTTNTEPVIKDVYSDVGQWVDGWLAQVLEGKFLGAGSQGQVLCPQWFAHPMVALRLHALWREWERANRADDMSGWWVQHFDAHARTAFDGTRGPMYACTPTKHRHVERFVPQPVPAGWFDPAHTPQPPPPEHRSRALTPLHSKAPRCSRP